MIGIQARYGEMVRCLLENFYQCDLQVHGWSMDPNYPLFDGTANTIHGRGHMCAPSRAVMPDCIDCPGLHARHHIADQLSPNLFHPPVAIFLESLTTDFVSSPRKHLHLTAD